MRFVAKTPSRYLALVLTGPLLAGIRPALG